MMACGTGSTPQRVFERAGQKTRLLGFRIVHVCFPEVGDSVVGVLCLEILRAKLPHEFLG